MFTFFCTTCEAKLVGKDEELIGKIVPCPQCGSMVLVQPSDDAPTPLIGETTKPVRHKRFPDVLTHGTASGVIGHLSGEHLRAEAFLETIPKEPDVSETEVKTRKILIGILVGLLIFLLVALGFLMIFQEPERKRQTEPPPIIQIPPENPPVVLELVEEPSEGPSEEIEIKPLPIEELPEALLPDVPSEPEPLQDEPIQTADDILSAIERQMPGFVDASVPDIDIDAKLALPINELNFDQSSLIEFVRVISQLTGVPMTLDIDEMKPRSLSAQTPVSGRFRETTAGEILTKTLATLGLQRVAVDRQIRICPSDTVDEADLTFDVSDFTEQTADLTAEVLAERIQRLIAPDASVAVLPDSRLTLVQNENNRVKSPMRQREEILRFLEQLRAVRQLPQKTEWTGETLAPEVFGWDRVMVPMTLNHYRSVPLSRIIAQVETATNLTVLVDHQSLHRALTPLASVQATVRCDGGTVNDVLELSLASVDVVALVYRIIDHQTLEITTMESVRQPAKMVMEVHRYELQADETPEDIVRSLRSAVFPDSWVVPEHSETRFGGDIVIDHPSNCLFVRQNQPAQRQIRLFLSALEPFEDEESLAP